MEYLDLAITAAKKAGKELQTCSKAYKFKGKYDLKAEADLVSEKIITGLIKKNFPDHDIYSEEMGDGRSGSEYLWILDPIDGTINFSKGMEDYCISIALEHKKNLVLGVIYQPATGRLCVAQKGKGTTVDGKKVSVSNIVKPSDMTASTDNPYDEKLRNENLQMISRIGTKVRQLRIIGSATLMASFIAQGEIDFYFYSDFAYWDFAASTLIIEEAGGKVTDLSGQPITIDSKNILASNGKAHEEILDSLKSN